MVALPGVGRVAVSFRSTVQMMSNVPFHWRTSWVVQALIGLFSSMENAASKGVRQVWSLFVAIADALWVEYKI